MRSLLLSLFVAVGAVAAEIPFTPPVPGPAAADQTRVAVASDGTDFLVVWRDERAVPHEAYATRVSRNGAVLDPTGIRIPVTDPSEAQVVWTGSSYLVVWANIREPAIVGARISREGVLIDGPRVIVADAQLSSLVRAGNRTVLGVRSGRTAPQQSEALFLDANGGVVSRVRLPDSEAPVVGWNGSQLVAVWTSGSGINPTYRIEGVRFDERGPIDATPRVLLGSNHLGAQIASDGRDFLIVTRNYDTSVFRSIHVRPDLTAGAPVDLPITDFTPASLLWTGTQYVLLYARGYDQTALRLDREGKPIGAPMDLDMPSAVSLAPTPRAASNGSDLFLAWSVMTTMDSDVHGAVLSGSTLASRSTALLSMTAKRQTNPILAWSGRNLLAVWNEADGTFARRMTADGVTGDTNPIRLGSASLAAAAVFNGTDYIVAMLAPQSGTPVTLSTLRIPATGGLRVENRTNRQLGWNAGSVALAYRNGTTLLTWHSEEAIEAVRLRSNGSWMDSVPLPVAQGRVRRVTAAAYDQLAFFVAWEEYEVFGGHGQTRGIAIHGARVTDGLTLLDPTSITVAAADGTESDSSVTWDGRGWLVVWQRIQGAVSEIRARRVSANGSLLNGPPSDPGVLLATGAAMPRVAWDGLRIVLTWLDYVPVETLLRIHAAGFADLGHRSGSRVLGETEAFGVSGRPSIAVVAPGVAAVAYARIAREPAYGGVARAFFTTISLTPGRRRAARG